MKKPLRAGIVLTYEDHWEIKKPSRGAWRGAGSSGCFHLSPVCGSTNERDQIDPRTR
jgi:hypothetical protein